MSLTVCSKQACQPCSPADRTVCTCCCAGSSLPPPHASYPTMPMMMGAMGGYQQHMAPQQAAMQQRALEVQQQQMQQFQAMEAFMSQQLMNRQDNTLLRYGNFHNSTRKKEPLQDRPEF